MQSTTVHGIIPRTSGLARSNWTPSTSVFFDEVTDVRLDTTTGAASHYWNWSSTLTPATEWDRWCDAFGDPPKNARWFDVFRLWREPRALRLETRTRPNSIPRLIMLDVNQRRRHKRKMYVQKQKAQRA